jgi:SAM-dependent methyltransferase
MADPYDDADLYDLEYADHTEDIAFYVDRARMARGAVLELGCGTGRLTLRIARAGVAVTGVDRSAAMLDRLRAKLLREPTGVRGRITLLERDYLQLEESLGQFALVAWPFNALHHCADTEQLRTMLTRARGWVAPRGRLVLDGYLPDRQLYDRDPEARFEPRTFVDPRSGEQLQSWEQGWWDEAGHIHHVIYVYARSDGSERRVHLRLRMFELAELRAAVEQAGFKLVREDQDFGGTPLGAGALKWVAVAEPA